MTYRETAILTKMNVIAKNIDSVLIDCILIDGDNHSELINQLQCLRLSTNTVKAKNFIDYIIKKISASQ